MLLIGDKWADRAIPQLLAQKPYVESESDGYDAQFYVQIAIQPDLHDPALQHAVDNLPYRDPQPPLVLRGGEVIKVGKKRFFKVIL